MTFEQIKELIDIVCLKGLRELEVERSDFRVKVVGPSAAVASDPVASPAPAMAPAVAAAGPNAPAAVSASAPAPTAGHRINSPIVGTFYEAPSPDAEAYVRVGDRVTEGQVLCIVEAMKLMNEIESDVAGEILEILPSNAQPVEYGEPLFVIRVDT